ncbi:MAG: hypothetical protein AB8G11_09305 [Saprospiraceae bacterium]
MKQTIIYILAILLFSSCLHKKHNQIKTDIIAQQNKMAAKTFSLSIVEAYFSEDCDKVFNVMSDAVLIMDGDGIFKPKEHDDKLCQSIKRAIRDKEKTMENYLETYKIEMLNREELEIKFDAKLPDYYKTVDSDFFFIGWELKEGKTKVDSFIWDDMFVFMVRNENGVWKIKGISG